MREKPNHIILHIGTNDLNSDRPPDLLNLLNLFTKCVSNTCFFYKHDVYKHIQAQVW